MRRIVWPALLVVCSSCQQMAGEGTNGAVEAPSFVNEGTINAPVAAVWKVWTSNEGYKRLGVAKADVDFRVGGLIRSHYGEKGVIGDDETIQNRILAYEPQRMIAIRIDRPPKSFPFKEAWKSTWTVITLSDAGNGRTHLRVASMGYGTDEESMKMRKFFEAGNGWTVKALQESFAGTTNGGDAKK